MGSALKNPSPSFSPTPQKDLSCVAMIMVNGGAGSNAAHSIVEPCSSIMAMVQSAFPPLHLKLVPALT